MQRLYFAAFDQDGTRLKIFIKLINDSLLIYPSAWENGAVPLVKHFVIDEINLIDM